MEMPKRDDPQYIEIENFKDYELTNCIAYEMAIRNPEFIKFRKECIEEKISLSLRLVTKYYMNSGQIENLLQNIHEITTYNFQELKEYTERKNIESFEKFGISPFSVEDRGHTNEPIRSMVMGGEPQVMGEQYMENNTYLRNELDIKFSRPKVEFRNMKTAYVKLNLALPQEELSSYIEEIKKEYISNPTIIKTVHDIFTDEEPKLNSNLSMEEKKIIMANRFYTYDYITYIQKEIKESSKRFKDEFNENVQNINRDDYYTYDEKQEQIKQLEDELKDNISSDTPTNIIKKGVKNKTFNIATSTAMRYYDFIKPFIDDMKYKELITGIQ